MHWTTPAGKLPVIREPARLGSAAHRHYVISSRETAIERPWDNNLIEHLNAAGVRHARLSAEDHRHREREWRKVYGHAFRTGLRHRHGAKAVHEYLNESATHWMLVPFLSNVPGTPMHVLAPRSSAFECEGALLELGEFSEIEFFVSPPDFAWTFVRTHEDFALGGPYLVRAEWVTVAMPIDCAIGGLGS